MAEFVTLLLGAVSSASRPPLLLWALPQNNTSPFLKLWEKFSSLVHNNDLPLPLKHNIVHHIEMRELAVISRFCHLAPDRLCITKDELKQMLSLGIIHPSKSSWLSALHMVSRKSQESGIPAAITRPSVWWQFLIATPCLIFTTSPWVWLVLPSSRRPTFYRPAIRFWLILSKFARLQSSHLSDYLSS